MNNNFKIYSINMLSKYIITEILSFVYNYKQI